MSSTDFHEFVRISSGKSSSSRKPRAAALTQPALGPRSDALGAGLLSMHLAVGFYMLLGWAVTNAAALIVYDLFLPAVMLQWALNHGSCVLNNLESRIRFGHWRCAANPEEGGFLRMLSIWWFGFSPSSLSANAACYAATTVAWLLGLTHLYWVAA
jgi:hypothetical protein